MKLETFLQSINLGERKTIIYFSDLKYSWLQMGIKEMKNPGYALENSIKLIDGFFSEIGFNRVNIIPKQYALIEGYQHHTKIRTPKIIGFSNELNPLQTYHDIPQINLFEEQIEQIARSMPKIEKNNFIELINKVGLNYNHEQFKKATNSLNEALDSTKY